MSYSLYEASFPLAKNALSSLEATLKKCQSSPVAASIPTARIHADMLPFTFQVHSVTNTIQNLVARTMGSEPTPYENDMVTLEDMLARVEDVQKKLEAGDEAVVNGRSDEMVTMGMGPGKQVQLLSWQYVQGYVLPNMFFHLVTAYDIARKEGVEVGKLDYLSSFMKAYVSI